MPKKLRNDSQQEQSERFNQAVRDLIADGSLNTTEAEAAIEKMLKAGARIRPESNDSSDLG